MHMYVILKRVILIQFDMEILWAADEFGDTLPNSLAPCCSQPFNGS